MTVERQEAGRKTPQQSEIEMEEMRKRKETEEALKQEKTRMAWRCWGRRVLVTPDLQDSKGAIRVTFRLPGDKRTIRQFLSTATLTSLYTYVDAQLIPLNLAPEEDPVISPNGDRTGEAALEKCIIQSEDPNAWWGFKLVLAYPRREIQWEVGRQLSEVEVLRGGGQIMVEMVERQAIAGDDGYTSEDSE